MDDRRRGRPLGRNGRRRTYLMKRGEVRVIDLDPVRGSEANKRRPAVIVSNDGANSTAERLGRGVLTVVPVTSRTNGSIPSNSSARIGPPGGARTRRLRPSRSGRWR